MDGHWNLEICRATIERNIMQGLPCGFLANFKAKIKCVAGGVDECFFSFFQKKEMREMRIVHLVG